MIFCSRQNSASEVHTQYVCINCSVVISNTGQFTFNIIVFNVNLLCTFELQCDFINIYKKSNTFDVFDFLPSSLNFNLFEKVDKTFMKRSG